MSTVRKVVDDIYWVGGNDHRLELFENVHPIPQGVSYNNYLLLDEKTVLLDTVDPSVCGEMLDNVATLLDGRPLDYLIINHMEPDHAGSLEEIVVRYPDVKIISTEKAFLMMRQFGFPVDGRDEEVKEGDVRSFGTHDLTFVEAPMVHWPEAMVTFDTSNGVLFSADAFGSFIGLDGVMFADEVNFDRDWLDEARRYYTNIVGKYGAFVQAVLAKAGTIPIQVLAPLHGPVWREDLGYILGKYDKWSRYEPEEAGVLLVYASMYGNTEYAAQSLASRLYDRGVKNVNVYDVSNTDVSYLISDAFKLSHIVLASCTYNLNIYPPMETFLRHMKMLNMQYRKVALIENGSWAPQAGEKMAKFIDEEMKMMDIIGDTVTIASKLNQITEKELDTLADEIAESVKESEAKLAEA